MEVNTRWNHTVKPSVFEVVKGGAVLHSGGYADGLRVYERELRKEKFRKHLFCLNCGIPFEMPKYRIKLTCSPKCRGEHVAKLIKGIPCRKAYQ
jgi:hypothetical protein